MCQANVPAQWEQLPQCQMTRLWIIDLSKSIVSTSISRPLSVGHHLCVWPYPVWNHCRSPSAHTRWLPSGSRRLTHSMDLCVGECCVCVCMCLWDREWLLNVTFVGVHPQSLCYKCWIEYVKIWRCQCVCAERWDTCGRRYKVELVLLASGEEGGATTTCWQGECCFGMMLSWRLDVKCFGRKTQLVCMLCFKCTNMGVLLRWCELLTRQDYSSHSLA